MKVTLTSCRKGLCPFIHGATQPLEKGTIIHILFFSKWFKFMSTYSSTKQVIGQLVTDMVKWSFNDWSHSKKLPILKYQERFEREVVGLEWWFFESTNFKISASFTLHQPPMVRRRPRVRNEETRWSWSGANRGDQHWPPHTGQLLS